MPDGFQKSLERLMITLRPKLDGPAGQVSDPAPNPQLLRGALGEVAESNPLNLPLNDAMTTSHCCGPNRPAAT